MGAASRDNSVCVCMGVHACACACVCACAEERNGEVVQRTVRSKPFSRMGAARQPAHGRRVDTIRGGKGCRGRKEASPLEPRLGPSDAGVSTIVGGRGGAHPKLTQPVRGQRERRGRCGRAGNCGNPLLLASTFSLKGDAAALPAQRKGGGGREVREWEGRWEKLAVGMVAE